MMFQLATTLGIFTANMINYGTEKLRPWGWRLSLGLAAAPAILMAIGGIFLPETPNSLIERGLKEKGQKVLEKIRGTSDIHAETSLRRGTGPSWSWQSSCQLFRYSQA